MALNKTAYQELILEEIGASLSACDDDESCSAAKVPIAKLWEMFGDKGEASLRLQYLFTKRAAIDWLLGQTRTATNAKLGPFDSDCKSIFTNLLELRKIVNEQIRAESIGGMPLVGEIEQTAPHMVEADEWPDPNSRIYRGDPIEV